MTKMLAGLIVTIPLTFMVYKLLPYIFSLTTLKIIGICILGFYSILFMVLFLAMSYKTGECFIEMKNRGKR